METDINIIMGRIVPYLDIFDGVLRRGHATYERYPADVVLDHDASTQAHCTYRHILKEGRSALDGLPHVEHLDIRGQNLWLFKDVNVACRFKKTDEDGVSANYPTPQATAFDDGDELPGLPAAPTRLTVGYLLDETGLGYVRSQVSLPTNRGAMWCAAIVSATTRGGDEVPWYEVNRQKNFRY